MITHFRKNCMGTVSFDAQFKGQRKPQDFVVYPLHSGNLAQQIKVQSDTRIGYISLLDGTVTMTRSIPGGAYQPHLATATPIDRLNAEELLNLKAAVFATASGKAGTTGVIHTDNSAALEVFGATA